MSSAVRSTALRAGGACVRCRKGKTKCVYDNGRAPCKNCAKGMHECYLPSESMSHGGHGVSPARVQHRVRDSLPSERIVPGVAGDRQGPPASAVSRHVSSTNDKYVPFPSPSLAFSRSFFFAPPLFFLELFTSTAFSAFSFPSTPHFFAGAGGGAGWEASCAISGRCALPPLRGPASGCSPPRLATPLDAPKMAPLALPLGATTQAPSPISFSARPPFSNPSPLNLACSVRILPSQSRLAWRLPLIKRRTTRSSLRLHPFTTRSRRQVSRRRSCVSGHRTVLPRPSSFGLRRSGSFWGPWGGEGARRDGGDAADRGAANGRMRACMLPIAFPLEIMTALKPVDGQTHFIPDGLANPGQH